MATPVSSGRLPPPLSVYIDLLRVIAALIVLVSHYPLTINMIPVLNNTNFAYDAVIVFFVVSGYVISYSAAVLEGTLNKYIANRMARILPVAISAVLFSSIIFFMISDIKPHVYGSQPPIYFWLSSVLQSITFTNQIWNNNEIPFYNGPYWSLAIEVWCYVFYGLIVFSRGWVRLAAILFISILVGPKTLLMFPMWLAGSAAFHLRQKFALPKTVLMFLLLMPASAYWAVQLALPRDWSYAYAGSHVEALIGFGLEGAANFGWGYILAVLVALHLYALGELCKNQQINLDNPLIKTIRLLSGYTFTLYLFHIPLVTLLNALGGTNILDFSLHTRLSMYAMIFFMVYVIGNIVEHKKATFRTWAHYVVDPFTLPFKPSLKL